MATTTSWNLDLLDPTWTSITMDAAERPSTYENLVEIKDGNDRNMFPLPDRVKTTEVGRLGPMAETQEHNSFYEDQPVKGYMKETVHKKYTVKLVFTEETMEDDLYGITMEYAKQIGEAYRLTRNLQVAQLFDNAFNTTYYTGPDGLAICSTAHTSRNNASTRANKLANSLDFSYAGVQYLLTLAMRHKDMRGYPDPRLVEGSVNVLIQPEDDYMFTTLFSDRSQYEPISNSNAPNVLKDGKRNFNKVLNVFQTGTGTTGQRLWFLQDAAQKGLWIVDRKKLTTSSYLHNGNKDAVYDGRARYSVHVKDVWGTWGSGDGAAA